MDATVATSLSDALREARVAKGLELNDIAEITHVRKEYLTALEEGRYGDLPEDIYARNFLRLYAQAVGLDDAKMLERFSRERRAALGINTVSDAVENGYREVTPKRRNPSALWLPIIILLAVIGGLGYFVFNRYGLPSGATNPSVPAQPQAGTTASGNNATEGSTPVTPNETDAAVEGAINEAVTNSGTAEETPAPVESSETVQPTADAETGTSTTTSEPATSNTTATVAASVRFSLVTNPPGAEATLDNYPFPARTPFFNAPITPRAARVLRITLEGYQPYEELLDITADTSKAITLVPVGATEAAVLGETPASTATAGAGQGQLGITIEADTWLEVYQSTVRGEGERLVYTTVSPGQSYTFNLPVFVHVGNGAGVRLNQNGQDVGLMGSSGEVTGRSFGQPLPPTPATPAPTEPQPADTQPEGPQ
jgi:cytoskeletal protein RodZ